MDAGDDATLKAALKAYRDWLASLTPDERANRRARSLELAKQMTDAPDDKNDWLLEIEHAIARDSS